MQIALVRIDDRLIHGQVVMGWIPHLKVEVVIVAADAVASDQTQTALMQMAMPAGVELLTLSVEQAARRLCDTQDRRRVLVLTPGPLEALRLLDQGASFQSVNVGGLHYTAGRVQLGKAIFLSPEDREALRAIALRGAALEGRALPDDATLDVLEMLGEGGQ
ncbi:MAG TPA: PTS mannose/fructose/sorbose transporter subunit IIB [Elusimicrobia bacterium]|nr:PTS mannose/fructose/sorbose transporter subunit IIB [Elusimicrobiota bacterium]HBT61860.1 PTS mannose/fructose/sorbose transporter subunit IIB [Elusimicrobiota bacterium]